MLAARISIALALAGLIAASILVFASQQVQYASAAGPVQMSLNVTSPLGQCDDPQQPTTCDVPVGTEFQVAIVASSPPTDGYDTLLTSLFFGDLPYEPTFFVADELAWPDSAAGPARQLFSRGVRHSSATGVDFPRPVSNYDGNLVEVTLRCPQTADAYPLAVLVFGTFYGGSGPSVPKTTVQAALDLFGDGNVEEHDLAALIEVNCVEAPPVGGVALEPDQSELGLEAGGGSAANASLFAGVVAAASAAIVVAFGGAAAYARRRVDR